MEKEELLEILRDPKRQYRYILHEKWSKEELKEFVKYIVEDSTIIKKERMFYFIYKYERICFYRKELQSGDELCIIINPYHPAGEIWEWKGNERNVMSVVGIGNSSGTIETIFMDENGIFYNQDTKEIAKNEDELFEYVLTKEYDYHRPITDKLYDILKDAGWYEGRKVDISEEIAYYKAQGTPLTSEQIEFLEEFTNIRGKRSDGESFCISLDVGFQYNLEHKVRNEYVDMRTLTLRNGKTINCLQVGVTQDGMYTFGIGANGLLYDMYSSQCGRTVLEGLQWILAE